MGFFHRFFGPPSKSKFAQHCLEALRLAGEPGPLNYDAVDFCIRKDRQVASLANSYIEYCAASQPERRNVVKRWARCWFAIGRSVPVEFDDIRPDLYPAVRSRAFYHMMELRTQVEYGKRQEWPHMILGEDFAVSLLHDMGGGLRTIREDELETWGVTFYEALEVAMENLRQLPMKCMGLEEAEGLYVVFSGDNHDASRVLLIDVIRGFRLRGVPVAMLPTRDMLVVAGSEDFNALRLMLNLARDESEKEHHLISTVALELAGDNWEPWRPAPDHPLHDEFELLHVQQRIGDYRVQKELLDKLHEENKTDAFVAPASGIRNEATGCIHTYSVWGSGITSWLPQTDIITFLRADDDSPRRYEWERVSSVVGNLLQPLNLYPPLFRVDDFPTEEQFAAMGPPCDP